MNKLYSIVIALILCSSAFAEMKPIDPALIHGIWGQEGSWKLHPVDGDDGKAIGPFQIWYIYWKDAVEFDPSIGGKYADCRNYKYALKVVTAYMNRYGAKFIASHNLEALARIHNGGPMGYRRRDTIKYWNDVKKKMTIKRKQK